MALHAKGHPEKRNVTEVMKDNVSRYEKSRTRLSRGCSWLKVRKVLKVFEQRIIVSLLRKNFKAMAGRSRNPRRLCPKGMTEIGLPRTTFVLAANFILPVFANWASKNVTGPYAPEVFAPFWRYDPFFSQGFALDRVPHSTIASPDRFTRWDCLSVYFELRLFI